MKASSSSIHRLTRLAIYIAAAFLISYIESLVPLPLPFPGMKLGLANLIMLIVLYQDGLADALIVSVLRSILNSLTFGNLFRYFQSFGHGIAAPHKKNRKRRRSFCYQYQLHWRYMSQCRSVCCSMDFGRLFCSGTLCTIFIFLWYDRRNPGRHLCQAVSTAAAPLTTAYTARCKSFGFCRHQFYLDHTGSEIPASFLMIFGAGFCYVYILRRTARRFFAFFRCFGT